MTSLATVGFVYSEACPLHCDFCCHTREVVGPGRLSPEKIVPVIADFAGEPSVKRFAFTGGDPFVHYREILETLEACRALGVTQPFHAVTSGYWAKTADQVRDILVPLRTLGMDAICLSYDREHARWVTPRQIEMIVNCARSLEMDVTISGVFWNQEDKVDDLLPNLAQGGSLAFASQLVAPIGRARRTYGSKPRYDLTPAQKASCFSPNYYDISIYPTGDAYPCCSGGFNKEGRLECGNVFVDRAQVVLQRAFAMFHARIAKELGFDRLYAKVARMRPDLLDQLVPLDTVDSVCQVCSLLHANSDLMSELEPVYAALELDYILEQIERHAVLKDEVDVL